MFKYRIAISAVFIIHMNVTRNMKHVKTLLSTKILKMPANAMGKCQYVIYRPPVSTPDKPKF